MAGGTRMIVYLSGKITGNDNYRNNFAKAEYWVRLKGHKVINTAKVGDSLPELTYEQYMQIDYKLIEIADCVCMIKGWQTSKGAKAELAYAKSIGKKVIYQEYFGRNKKEQNNETRTDN
jgi:hypothetical protein